MLAVSVPWRRVRKIGRFITLRGWGAARAGLIDWTGFQSAYEEREHHV
jgi:hypothetical protein